MKILIAILLLSMFSLNLRSQDLNTNPNVQLEIKENFLKGGNFNKDLSSSLETNLYSIENSKEKSPVLAAILSAAIPGAGEIYAGNYLKGAIFLGVEAGIWTLNIINNNKGDNQTEVYQNYANEHWDVYKYAAWLKSNNFSGSEGIDLNSDKETLRLQVNLVESQNFSHTLPNYGAQQYYEVIGKYQNFVTGWSSANASLINNDPNSSNYYFNVRLPQVLDYMQSRQDANDYYQFADRMISVAILNRVLSVADAIWTVSVFNSDLEVRTSARLKNTYSFKEGRNVMSPFANIQISGF